MSSKAFAKKVINVALPLGGFAIGWFAFSVAEDNQWIGENTQRRLSIANLKFQLQLQKLLPASVVERYGYSDSMLRSMVDSMEKGYSEDAMNNRVTFDEILSECELREQIGFLEEHASEDIPYFYIADIFHSWARLHADSVCKKEAAAAESKEEPLLRDIPDFDSPILCNELWVKMLNNVVPFDVSVRALSVLAVNNKANARRLADGGSVDDLLSCYEAYKTKREEGAKGSDLVDRAEVYAATLCLLRAMNDTAVHTRRFPGIGRFSTRPSPIARRVTDGDRWCRSFAPAQADPQDVRLLPQSASLFADLMAEKLKCSERLLSAQ